MFTKATLYKITSTHNNVRTDIVEGGFYSTPKIGESFMFISEPIDKNADVRIICTSDVKNAYLGANKTMIIETRNSFYKLVME